MRTLIIPDIHENIEPVRRILDDECWDDVVFLGDWFDRFSTQPGDALSTARWLAANQADSRFRFIWGNHDLPYAFSHRGLACSGHQYDLKCLLLYEGVAMRSHFRLHTRVGRFLVSHAGFHHSFIGDYENLCAGAIKALEAGDHRLPGVLGPGWARGGDQMVGGCTWLDWNDEFEPTDTPQIVGHTIGKEPRWKGEALCLDTQLAHYAVYEDGDLTVKETKN